MELSVTFISLLCRFGSKIEEQSIGNTKSQGQRGKSASMTVPDKRMDVQSYLIFPSSQVQEQLTDQSYHQFRGNQTWSIHIITPSVFQTFQPFYHQFVKCFLITWLPHLLFTRHSLAHQNPIDSSHFRHALWDILLTYTRSVTTNVTGNKPLI